MKNLLKQKVANADQASQPNGLPAGGRQTRQSASTFKLELVDPNRRAPAAPMEADSSQRPHSSVQPVQGVKRPYAPTFATPVYATSVTVQQTNSKEDLDDSSYESASASYSQPAKKGSVLRNTLSGPKEEGRQRNRPGRKPTKPIDHMSEEEYRRLEDRRQKNKEAAQRCRSRRMGKIQELEERIKLLNGEISLLKTTSEKYRNVPAALQYYLGSNTHVCCLAMTPPTTMIPTMPVNHDHSHQKPGPSSSQQQQQQQQQQQAKQAAGAIKRPQFLKHPNPNIANMVAEQKRPSSQPSPIINLPLLGTPGLLSSTPGQADFLSGWSARTPGLPSFGNVDAAFLMDDRTPSRDLAVSSMLYNALDLETPNTEGPRLTAL